ncbi:MAG: response regulator transcription factor [Bacteroidales bacterium]|jgi:DNA-binding NarL/FixJ family response regulator
MSIKVLIADDNQLFREILAKLFKHANDIEIVAQAENGLEVLDRVMQYQPDIVLMDIAMPRLNGIDTTVALVKQLPGIKIIALTAYDDKTNIKGMLTAGARGYLLKSCKYDQLVDAIIQVNNGKKYISTDVAEIIIQDYLGQDSPGKIRHPKLTERESEVLTLLAEGKTIREISEILFISVKTVGSHKENIFEKMEFENMTQLIKFALKNGIVSL